MKSKVLTSAVRALSLMLLLPAAHLFSQDRRPVFSQDRRAVHFSGLINDYSPLSAAVKGSPWEMHGQWSMDVYPGLGRADFAADLTMSGYGRTSTNAVDPTQPLVNPHTHHILLKNVKIEWDMTGCPTYLPPATMMGFQLKDKVKLLTGNGSTAPFETSPPSSTLQVCVTGGDYTQYSVAHSNITLVFDGPAVMHFGGQAIHGVVRKPLVEEEDRRPER